MKLKCDVDTRLFECNDTINVLYWEKNETWCKKWDRYMVYAKKLRKGVGIKAGNNAGHADLHMIIWFNNHAKALKNLRWPWKQFGIKTTDVSYRLKAPNTSDYSVKRVLNLYLLRPCFWYKPLIHRSQSPARGPDPAREGFKSGPRAFLELFCILTISCK